MIKKHILVICWGNIIRSPIAEILINREINKRNLTRNISCISRGIQGSANIPHTKFPNITFYKKEFSAAKKVLTTFQIDLTKHQSKPIDQNTIKKVDLILIFDQKINDQLQIQFPEAMSKVHFIFELIDKTEKIEDPEGVTEQEKYLTMIRNINECVVTGFPKMLKFLKL